MAAHRNRVIRRGPRVARWNGSTWSPIGATTGCNARVRALTLHADGSLLAGGVFSSVNGSPIAGLARWNGTSWLSSGLQTQGLPVYLMQPLANGHLVFGTGDALYRATPNAMSQLLVSGCNDITRAANGDLLAVGSFLVAGNVVSAHVARMATPCPALATTLGNGCTGSGGSNTLTAISLPWADGTFRGLGTGLPPTSYVFAVWGLSPVVPPLALDSVFVEALPGCKLHIAPDAIETLFTTTGTVQSQIGLPNIPPLVGVTFYHQMLPVVLDAQLHVLEISSTNALQLTVGSF